MSYAKELIINGYRFAWYDFDEDSRVIFFYNVSGLSNSVIKDILKSVILIEGPAFRRLDVDPFTGEVLDKSDGL